MPQKVISIKFHFFYNKFMYSLVDIDMCVILYSDVIIRFIY